MASAIYSKAKESFISQSPSIDLDSDTIKVALINTSTDYTFSAAHQYMSSVTAYSGTTDQTLGTKTIINGTFDAADSSFSLVTLSGIKTIAALVIYKDTGVTATSRRFK